MIIPSRAVGMAFLGIIFHSLYYCTVLRNCNKYISDQMVRKKIYEKIGYTGLDHANNTSRYKLDRSLRA